MSKVKFPYHEIYDLETYPNCFTYCSSTVDGQTVKVFEISSRRDDTEELIAELRRLIKYRYTLVGFNNVRFDYNILHFIMEKAVKAKEEGKPLKLTPKMLYNQAQKVIESFKGDGFGMSVRTQDRYIEQLDLYLINHFDNNAKATSLKTLEVNMRSENVTDLPFPVGKILTEDEMDELIVYNKKDVSETLKFYNECLSMIEMRTNLTEKFGFDCLNLNDGKIGANFFINRIEKINPTAFYDVDERGRRRMRQTRREVIHLKDCLFPYVRFKSPEFQSLHKWFKAQVIERADDDDVVMFKGVFAMIEEHDLFELTNYCEKIKVSKKLSDNPEERKSQIEELMKEYPMGRHVEVPLKTMVSVYDENGKPIKEERLDAKGKPRLYNVKVPKISHVYERDVSKTLNVVFGGMRIDYGVGGLHGAKQGTVKECEKYAILSWDVASMYPNIAIANRVYPEHLGEEFCDNYEDFYNERKLFPKGTDENLAIKLGLNTVYGNSNSKYSPFYDPAYTLKITVNGQLSLSMLMEKIVMDTGARLLMANTDGFEIYIERDKIDLANDIVSRWEKVTGLEMEQVIYKAMYIRDVNNYLAVYDNGKVKCKGAYVHSYDDLAWHQDHSSLIVPKAVYEYMINDVPVSETLNSCKNPYDFMLSIKVPRSNRLVLADDEGNEESIQNISRFYPCKDGRNMIKYMPPLEGKTEERANSILSKYKVAICNDVNDFDFEKVDYSYYYKACEDLLTPFENLIY